MFIIELLTTKEIALADWKSKEKTTTFILHRGDYSVDVHRGKPPTRYKWSNNWTARQRHEMQVTQLRWIPLSAVHEFSQPSLKLADLRDFFSPWFFQTSFIAEKRVLLNYQIMIVSWYNFVANMMVCRRIIKLRLNLNQSWENSQPRSILVVSLFLWKLTSSFFLFYFEIIS